MSPEPLPESEAEVVLLHNPRCSKSRKTKELLEERGVAFVERNYLEDPLTRDELNEIQKRLGRPPEEWIRKGEADYAAAGLDAHSTGEALLDAMAKAPILMERPIVIRGARAAVGRPPEDVLTLL